MTRHDGREFNQLRDIKITRNYLDYAEGSCLYESGRTKVICAASIDTNVPRWMRDTGKGWITGEYAMMPRATHTRTPREVIRGKQGGRTHEIQRLIGRSLRSIVHLDKIGEVTITVDCDVLQADGGTRTAALSGGFVALYDALMTLAPARGWKAPPITEFMAATSVGIVGKQFCLDLNYEEDSKAEVDMNVIMTESGKIIEIQGTAEAYPFSRDGLDTMIDMAQDGIKQIIEKQKSVLEIGT
jgi:ribonuclease PH